MWFFLLLLSWTPLKSLLIQKLHPMCLNLFAESPHQESLSAFFCGEKLPWGSWRWTISATGLIHLFVISGYHLGVTRNILVHLHSKWRYLATWTEFFILLLYSLMSGFQAPVVRALVERQLRWRYSEWTAIALSPLLCLIIAPHWWNNLSLYLSVTARVAVFLCARRSVISQAILIPGLLAPLVMFAHPVGQVFAQLSIPLWLLGLFSHGVLWLISAVVDHPLIIILVEASSWLLAVLSKVLIELEKLYPPLWTKPQFFLKKWAPLYAATLILFSYWIFRQRWQESFSPTARLKNQNRRSHQKFSIFGLSWWSWALFSVLIFSPSGLDSYQKSKKISRPSQYVPRHLRP